MLRRLTSICAALLCGLVLARAEVPSAIAIKDARVVPVGKPELGKATVLMRDGLIADVGAAVEIPPDAWVIDGTGLTVYPGFIDGLSTWGIPDAPAPARTGTGAGGAVTPTPRPRGPEDRPLNFSYERAADLVKPTDKRLDGARAAGFTTAATFPGHGIFEGLGAIVNLAGTRAADMVVAEPIGQEIALRTGSFRSGFPNSLMGAIAYVRQVYLDLGNYREAQQQYSAHVTATKRPGYDHYLEGLAESPRVLLPAVEAQQIDRMLDFGLELKVPFVLYGLHEGYRRVEELKRANVPVLVSLKWPEKPKDADPADIPNYRELVMRDQAPGVPGLLAKAGVKFGFYSDGAEPGDLKKAVKKAIDAGLPRAEAVRALTLSTAEIYGLADRLGSIEPGKIANLVVTRGDVFEEKTTIEYVFIDGNEFRPSKETPEKKPEGEGKL